MAVVAVTLIAIVEDQYNSLPISPFLIGLEPCQNVGQLGGACKFWFDYSPINNVVQYLFLVLVLLVSYRWAARWILAPIRNLVPAIEQMGPQNLGHRVRPDTRHRDELSTLGQALDDMMDRIAAGYEGQRRFAANASHELRTPLALQRMLIEVGMTDSLTGEQATLLTSQLLQANDRNERLIEGLLVLSQADQRLVAHTPQRLDEITALMIRESGAHADKLRVTVSCELQPRVVHGDQVLLERLVRNLVHNAIKYNHPGGTVHVTVGVSPALSVVNTGPAVPQQDVARLFEPFTRLGSDRIDHSGGSGLGLAIARSIVQAHHGTVAAEAQPTGGLRMSVDFPLDQSPGHPDAHTRRAVSETRFERALPPP
ncbi:MAG: hypothetical protein QOH97_5620 [Actinoplanes sp.]|jgi:signal transduction histidine kinase|nr:hypothetical protein [Actinoplanes sp.]